MEILMLAEAVLVEVHKARHPALAVQAAVVMVALEAVQYKELMVEQILAVAVAVTATLAYIVTVKMAALVLLLFAMLIHTPQPQQQQVRQR
jgi:hypothetical protein